MCERNIDWLPLTCAPNRNQAHNPGMIPDLELNQHPFAFVDDAQATEPCGSGLGPIMHFKMQQVKAKICIAFI